MGLSAFYARNDAEVDDLGADQLERFSLLGCYRVIDLQAAGFEIWPTFRTPQVTIAFTGDLDERLAALVDVAHEVRTNPYRSRLICGHSVNGMSQRRAGGAAKTTVNTCAFAARAWPGENHVPEQLNLTSAEDSTSEAPVSSATGHDPSA